jgi:hypothetical protein
MTDSAYDRARDMAPFSSSTEGEAWMANWCNVCLVDAPYRNGLKGATGCPLLAVALCGRTPAEWIESEPLSLGNRYQCVNFRRPGGGGGGEPRPKPTPRGQLELFGRDKHEQRRMLTPLPDQTPDRVMA